MNNTPIQQPIAYTSNSLKRSLTASMDHFGAIVQLAKRHNSANLGAPWVCAVLCRVRSNQRSPRVKVGYQRFGFRPIWCETFELPASSDETLGADRVKALLETTVQRMFQYADESITL